MEGLSRHPPRFRATSLRLILPDRAQRRTAGSQGGRHPRLRLFFGWHCRRVRTMLFRARQNFGRVVITTRRHCEPPSNVTSLSRGAVVGTGSPFVVSLPHFSAPRCDAIKAFRGLRAAGGTFRPPVAPHCALPGSPLRSAPAGRTAATGYSARPALK